MVVIRIRRQHVPPLRAGHPWVYQQAIDRTDGPVGAGEVVEVRDTSDSFIGLGFYSPNTAIPVRLLVTVKGRALDDDLIRSRLRAARRLRMDLGLPSDATTGYRLVNAEGDGLAGLTVDVFGDAVVVLFNTIGMKKRADVVFDTLSELLKPKAIIESKDREFQRREGFEVEGGLVRGSGGPLWTFRENGLELTAELPGGQKTGFYFDQRENRRRIKSLAAGRRILDLYCYTGAFSIGAALEGGEEIVGVDTSAVALLAADEHASRNGVKGKVKFVRADARKYLQRRERDSAGTLDLDEGYDLVVLDPPKLMPTSRSRDQARRAYRSVNAAALRAVAPGGLLASCSCSGHMSSLEFLRLLGLASGDARRRTTVLEVRGAGADHPAPPAFDQGRYLKFVLLKVER